MAAEVGTEAGPGATTKEFNRALIETFRANRGVVLGELQSAPRGGKSLPITWNRSAQDSNASSNSLAGRCFRDSSAAATHAVGSGLWVLELGVRALVGSDRWPLHR